MGALAITARPRTWDEIVGQDRAIGVLKDILSKGRFSPRGFVLEGPFGVGKTTTAHVLARALMCTGGNPLGCGKCPSCLGFQEQADGHPDFREVDGASYSGVAQARQIVDESAELPGVGRARVLLVDEAQRLSREAWDVYLKPLEAPESQCVFLFATTDAKRIPNTILSRCCTIRFARVATDVLQAFLTAVAARKSLDCDSDGLKCLARAAKGHVRDALSLLDKVSSMGRVTKALVETVVDTSYADMAALVLIQLATDQLPKAVATLDEMARTQPAARAVAEVFSAYGRAVYGDPEASTEEQQRAAAVKACFPDFARVTAVLIKWSSSDRIPVDALPLFAHELYGLRVTSQAPTDPRPATPAPSQKPLAAAAPSHNLIAALGAVKLKG